MWRRSIAAGAFAVLAAAWVHAQTPADEPPLRDLHEAVQHIAVTVKDRYGREETRDIPVTILRPGGDGPFPLVIMNHGRSNNRAQQGRQRYEALSRYLVGKGFVVLLPTRVGYADTYGDFDPEASGPCDSRTLAPVAEAASDQVLATLAFARGLPFVDASRWLVMGQSVGGFAAVATVARRPPGLAGGINFAGGVGGNPAASPGMPCKPQQVSQLWADTAKSRDSGVQLPMLWLYWQNDQYWGADNPKRWHEAWVAAGGNAEFHSLPAVGSDGHAGSMIDMDHWVPLAEAFLARLGFDTPGLVTRPAATNFARVDETDKLPTPASALRDSLYRRFLAAKPPRAFAIGPQGASGWSRGDWALGRALGFCQRRGEPCALYAVDDDVVWLPAGGSTSAERAK